MPHATHTHEHPTLPAMGHSHERALAMTAAIRLAAGTVFLGIGSAWSYHYQNGMNAGIFVYPLLAYLPLAALAFALRRHAQAQRISWVMPFVDIGLVFVVHYQGFAVDHAFPAAAASWPIASLGIYTLIVALVGLAQGGLWAAGERT